MAVDWDVASITDPNITVDHNLAVREIKGEKRHRGEQVRAALYTYRVCYVTKTVGRGLGRKSFQEYADELGYAKSYVTNLRRLGRAIVVHKVSPDSTLFSKLRNASVRKEVGQLLDSEVPQPHERLLDAMRISEPRTAAVSTTDAVTVLEEAGAVVAAALAEADLGQLQRMEEMLGDLFFSAREAVKRRTQEVHGD